MDKVIKVRELEQDFPKNRFASQGTCCKVGYHNPNNLAFAFKVVCKVDTWFS